MAICRTSAYSWVDLCAEKFLSFFCLLAKADVLTPPLSSSTEQSYTHTTAPCSALALWDPPKGPVFVPYPAILGGKRNPFLTPLVALCRGGRR